MPLSKAIVTLVFSLGILSGSLPAMSQEASASFKFTLFEVDGLVISNNYKIDTSFGERFGVTVPAPFTIDVPRQDNVTTFLNPGSGNDDLQLKIDFVTGDQNTDMNERVLIENQRFVVVTLGLGEPEERLQEMARFLANNGYNSAVASYEQNEYLGARATKVGDYDAVEVFGKYIDPSIGLLYVRLVGIPNPNGTASIFSVANIVADRFELTGLDDLALTASGKTLESFTYLNE